MASMSVGALALTCEERKAPKNSVVVKTILTSGEMEKSGMSEMLRRRVQRLRINLDWGGILSTKDQEWLELLVKKTTNNKRKQAFLGSDSRGLPGYLRHARLEDFPNNLFEYAYLDNASIKAILRACRE